MDDATWLASLKPGDYVIIESRNDAEMCRVHKVTPTGRITVSIRGGMGVREFNPDGRERGASDRFFTPRLVQPTQERRESIEGKALAARLERQKWADVSLETKRAIVAMLKDAA